MAVSILLVRALVETLEAAGFDRARLFEPLGFDPARIENGEGRLPIAEYDALVNVAMTLTEDAALGLHMGETANATTHSLTAHLVAHAPNMRAGLDALLRYQPLLDDRPTLNFTEGDRTATLFYDAESGAAENRRFRTEMAMVGFFRILRFFAPGAMPERVSFEYPAPGYSAEYARVFEGEVEFDAASTCLVMERTLLSVSALHQDAEFHALLETQAQRRVSRLSHSASYADRVRDRLLQRAPGDHEMDGVARALGLSVRSLRRRLQEEGVSYGDLVDEVRAVLAKQLLSEDGRSIEETAYEMGFSDPSAFHRAFKRWTGTTPSEFRRASLTSRAHAT